jgi:hypothetical protein
MITGFHRQWETHADEEASAQRTGMGPAKGMFTGSCILWLHASALPIFHFVGCDAPTLINSLVTRASYVQFTLHLTTSYDGIIVHYHK